MKDVMFGQMYPVDSPVHRMDARAKLLITIAYIVMVFFIDKFVVYGIVALSLVVVILLSRVPITKVLKSIRMIIILLIFTLLITVLLTKGDRANEAFYIEWWVITICPSGLISGGRLMCRLLLLVLGPTILTLTTTPVALTDAIEYLLTPLKLIKIPVHIFTLIMSIALRLVPTLMEETEKIINAQKARGAHFDHGNIFKRAAALLPVLIPLFINSFRRADELADAMDSRCYRPSGRTKMKIMRFSAFDYTAMLAMAALFFSVLLCTYNWWGFEWLNLVVIM